MSPSHDSLTRRYRIRIRKILLFVFSTIFVRSSLFQVRCLFITLFRINRLWRLSRLITFRCLLFQNRKLKKKKKTPSISPVKCFNFPSDFSPWQYSAVGVAEHLIFISLTTRCRHWTLFVRPSPAVTCDVYGHR